jgi:hypothetical protein
MELRCQRSLHVSRHGERKKNCPDGGKLAIGGNSPACGARHRNRKKCVKKQEKSSPDSTAPRSPSG